jgi:histone-lysine N-methyltransferase SETMAR
MDKEQLVNSVTDLEQRTFIKFGVILGKNAKEIHNDLIKALGSMAYPHSTVRRWVKDINKGRTDLSDQRGGAHNVNHERDERIERVEEQLAITRAWSSRMLALIVDIPQTTLLRILHENFHLTKRLGKWVPHNLTEEQRQARVDICHNNLLRYRRHPKLLDRTLAIDESWVRLYSPPDRDQQRFWLKPGEASPEIVAPELRERKAMLILAMDKNGVAFWHLCPEGQTVTAEVYRDFLSGHMEQWMAEKSIRKPILLHDNARPHKAVLVRDYLASQNIETWCHPPYSPDVHPCDFDAFRPLKRQIKAKRYNNFAELSDAISSAIQEVSQNGGFNGVNRLPERWGLVVEKEGQYI